MSCTGLTAKGAKCRRTSNCQWHVPIDCTICMDVIQPGTGLVTSCRHHFHENCLVTWFLESDVCPVCRATQDNKFVSFKKQVQERTAELYMDVLVGLEADLARARRRRAQRAE